MSKFIVYLYNDLTIILMILLTSFPKVYQIPVVNSDSLEERARTDAFQRTDRRDNPFSVLVLPMQGVLVVGWCSGTLLSPHWVLTAAHCLYYKGNKMRKFMIYAGGNSLQEIENKSIPLPKGFQVRVSTEVLERSKYDLALIRVYYGFQITEYVTPIQFAIEPWPDGEVRSCKVTGFGKVQIGEETPGLDKVRKTQVLQVKTPCTCHDWMPRVIRSKSEKYFACSLPKQDYGLCFGDSGSGLICDNRLQGVASMIAQARDIDTCDFVFHDRNSNITCGDRNTVSAFAVVCPHALWINELVDVLSDSEISPDCRDRALMITGSSKTVIVVCLNFTYKFWLVLQ